MTDQDLKIAELEARLDRLVRTQIGFQSEIATIRQELTTLKAPSRTVTPPGFEAGQPGSAVVQPNVPAPPPPYRSPVPPTMEVPAQPGTPSPQAQYSGGASQSGVRPPSFGDSPPRPATSSPRPEGSFSAYVSNTKESARSDLEKFIGENLISKIGILILILGVGIGTKYAIDNGWISPAMRLVFGYAMGLGLCGCAAFLKAKYRDFSAVLLSGGIAIMYFVTYFGYAYYELFPQPVAFGLMVVFTVLAVTAALLYSRQVIAHIGLVGAYAVPFLLSNNSGNYMFLFTYMAIINAGILTIAIRKHWSPLFYTSFLVTWIIFGFWFVDRFDTNVHFGLAAVFACVFFGLYYFAALIYRLAKDDLNVVPNAGLILTNSFVFYGFGFALMHSRAELVPYQGLFTVAHAALHSIVAQIVGRVRSTAVETVQVLTVLIMTFATIAIPVQFDGNRVTMIWAVEGAALFWFGRAKLVRIFEYFSYPIMLLATGSLLVDWVRLYDERTMSASPLNRQPLMNGDFVTALVFAAAFAFIYVINRREKEDAGLSTDLIRPFGVIVGSLGLFALYNAFRIEIGNYFHLIAVGNMPIYHSSGQNFLNDIFIFNFVFQLNYTLLFLTLLGAANLKKAKSFLLACANSALGVGALAVFATGGMVAFYMLRTSYMSNDSPENIVGPMHIAVRYLSYACVGALLGCIYLYTRSKFVTDTLPAKYLSPVFDFLLYGVAFITLSCELLNLASQFHFPEADKLGLSILWGVYALAMIVIGIAWNKKHLRIAAIVLLAVTLAKLFLYDVANLATIPKTVLFVSLGLLLLVVSFLYNKYKALIFKATGETIETGGGSDDLSGDGQNI